MSQTFDLISCKHIDTPKKMIAFFEAIDEVCKQYNLSISHEDYGGSFIIEEYKEDNINWLKYAQKKY